MKIVPILTALVLGASGSAVAEPDRPLRGDPDDPYYDRYGDRRPMRRDGWVTLTAPLANYDNRQFIKLGRDAGRFERLRLDVAEGRIFVRQILVQFGDGTNQKLVVGRMLRAGENIQIDLPGRARFINGLVIYTDPARFRRGHGEYVISGVPTRTQYGYPYATPRDYWRR